MEDIQPEHGAAHQEAADLVAAVVEDEAVPVGVMPLPPVGMFEQVGPVEVGQSVLVGGEV